MRGLANRDTVQKYASKLNAAGGAGATCYIFAVADEFHVIDSIHWSYDANHSAAGALGVQFGGVLQYYSFNAQNFARVGSIVFRRGLYTGVLNMTALNGLKRFAVARR